MSYFGKTNIKIGNSKRKFYIKGFIANGIRYTTNSLYNEANAHDILRYLLLQVPY